MRTRFFLILAAFVIAATGWQLVEPRHAYAYTCCTYSSDCGGGDVPCCDPGLGVRDCSMKKTGYCGAGCTQ